MDIRILHLIEGAKKAKGLTVIIDVFRAFSLTCYFFDRGVKKIIPVADVETALQLKKENPDYLLAGERDTKKIPGFDFGNSPFEILNLDLRNKTIVHTTSSGTQGIVNATNASQIITGSFVNADAVVNYIKKENPSVVSLVCMGFASKYPVEEDSFCAEYIKERLENKTPDFEKMKKIIRNTSGKRFFEPESQDYCPEEDFYLCMELNKFNFVLIAEKENNFYNLKKTEIKE